MISQWLVGLSELEREKFTKSLLSSKEVLDKFKEICYNKQLELNRVRLKDYDAPNWALKRSHEDGIIEGLEFLISLLTLDQRESK